MPTDDHSGKRSAWTWGFSLRPGKTGRFDYRTPSARVKERGAASSKRRAKRGWKKGSQSSVNISLGGRLAIPRASSVYMGRGRRVAVPTWPVAGSPFIALSEETVMRRALLLAPFAGVLVLAV